MQFVRKVDWVNSNVMSGYWQVIPSCTTKYKVELRELSVWLK